MMPSASTQDTRDGQRLRSMRRRLLKLSIGLATLGAMLPAAAFAYKIDGPSHSRVRPTSASARAGLLSNPTAVEYGLTQARAGASGLRVHIVNAAHGLCLDAMQQDDQHYGDKVQLWRCNGRPNQGWYLDGYFIRNAAYPQLHLCLDAIEQHDGSRGDHVQLWGCTGYSNQAWIGYATNNHTNFFFNAAHFQGPNAHSLVLEARGDARSSGDQIELWSYNGRPNQQWYVYAY